MPANCFIKLCRNKWDKDIKRSFHRFPTDRRIQNQWIEFITRFQQVSLADVEGKNVRICSDHFLQTDYTPRSNNYTLNRDAIPSVLKPGRLLVEETNNSVDIAPCNERGEFYYDEEMQIEETIEVSDDNNPVNHIDHDHDYYKPIPDEMSIDQQGDILDASEIEEFDLSSEPMSQLISMEISSSNLDVINKNSSTSEARKKSTKISRGTKSATQGKRVYSNIKCYTCTKNRLELQRLRRKCARLIKRNTFLSKIVSEKRNTTSIPEKSEFLVNNLRENGSKAPRQRRYCSELKNFALSFHCCSPRAYRRLQDLLVLPEERTLRMWTSPIQTDPGFFYSVLLSLKESVASGELRGNEECSICIDGMHLKKGLYWDPGSKETVGNVDFGQIIKTRNDTKLATEAYVILAIGLRSHWEVPIGYILSDGSPTGKELSMIIESAIIRLTDVGVVVRNVTMDGARSNVNALKFLGVPLQKDKNPLTMSPIIKHPLDSQNGICASLDTPHMMKLARNTMERLRLFRSPRGIIQWQFLPKLQKIQELEGLRLAPKLSKIHIEFQNVKMKVFVAGQTLSRHVGDAIKFLSLHNERLSNDLSFQDSEATVEFIYNINDIFDMTNSRTLGKGQYFFKKPISAETLIYQTKHLERLINYLYSLKTMNGLPLYKSRSRTFVVGFILTAKTIIHISSLWFQAPFNNPPHFKYFHTCRLQQDPLEHTFGNIRGSGGFNNNPSCVEFKYKMKKLLVINKLIPSVHENPEIFAQSSYSSLFIKCDKKQKNIHEEDIPEILLDCADHIGSTTSEFIKEILYYMCGWIVRYIARHLRCAECLSALISKSRYIDHSYCAPIPSNFTSSWTVFKNNGGLVYASNGVLQIVETSEKYFRRAVAMEVFPIKKHWIVYAVNKELSMVDIFPELKRHASEVSILEDDHSTQLIKLISGKFIESRVKAWTKNFNINLKSNKGNIREKHGRLIIFNNA